MPLITILGKWLKLSSNVETVVPLIVDEVNDLKIDIGGLTYLNSETELRAVFPFNGLQLPSIRAQFQTIERKIIEPTIVGDGFFSFRGRKIEAGIYFIIITMDDWMHL